MGKETRSGSSSSSKNKKVEIKNRADYPEGYQPLPVSPGQSSANNDDTNSTSVVQEILPHMKGLIDDLEKKIVSGIRTEMANILQQEMKLLRDELHSAKEEIQELKSVLKDQSCELDNLRDEIENIKKDANARERHSRSWNLVWLTHDHGKKYEQPDESADLALKFLNKIPEIQTRNVKIDVAHRIGGSVSGKPRPIIVRFLSKADLWFVMKYRKELMKLNEGAIFQDLTKTDRLTKQKYNTEITDLINKGHKAKFTNGHWVVDGKVMKEQDFKKV